ncbi:ComF family protein [Eubacterium barkeri]|uniref:ComF family protein n=1 Tax=Eubacterium barkeri TaxID=1528 RepID=A0A1H3JGK4_EUBBA|nr:ComF family protein [Eubacterium barkeri]SDY39056.1 comF family protein [Eubacterium barkeri]
MSVWGRVLKNALFPGNGTCPVCGRVLFSRDHFLCSRCQEDLPLNQGETCPVCGRHLLNGEAICCKDCSQTKDPGFQAGCVWLDYRENAKPLVYGMKFQGRQALCHWVGRQMAEMVMAAPWFSEIDCIIPVPLHESRLSERGYNQSMAIAQGLAREIEVRTGQMIPVAEGLVRILPTPHQIGQSRRERLKLMSSVFKNSPEVDIKGQRVLLVDDVITTGATLRACAATLLSAGAQAVFIAVCAGGGA